MNIISTREFIRRKQSDTIVVLGSGYSINNISDKGWGKIASYDSIGFNWFCHHKFGPTFYAIREQANTKQRNKATETRKRLFADMAKPSLASTCLIVHNVKGSKVYNYAKNHSRFAQDGIIVKDRKGKSVAAQFKHDIFKRGVFHGKSSLMNVIHIAIYLKYKRILFAGVDLRNSQYFWLDPKATRINIHQKRLKSHNRHPAAKYIFSMLKKLKKFYKGKMYTVNRKSLLMKILPYHEL